MKKSFLTLALMLCCCLNAFSQATSLTVDCQNPGFLASYIKPTDVGTVRNLTVSGEINQTDLAFIGNLIKNFNLKGHLDLGDVNITGNQLNGSMFGVDNCQLEFFAIPKNVSKLNNVCDWVKIDTLVAGSSVNPNYIYSYEGNNTDPNAFAYYSKKHLFDIKHLILREGTSSINIEGGSSAAISPLQTIFFPETMKEILLITNFKNLTSINIPSNLEYMGSIINTGIRRESDTLFVPQSVKTFWDDWVYDDGFDNAYINNGGRGTPNGHIRCVYLPNNLETFWVTDGCLHYGAKVDIHIRSINPPTIKNGWLKAPTVVYVPVSSVSIYENTAGWKDATIVGEIYVEGITLTESKVLYVGDEVKLQPQVLPTDATNKKVLWSSSNPAIVEVTKEGTLRAQAYGTAGITATTEDGGYEATCSISVFEHTTGIEMIDEISIPIDKTYTLNAHTLPLSTSDEQITYISSNNDIAIVNSQGIITAKKKGTCVITATSVDGGHTVTCDITVTQPVEELTLEKHSTSLKVGETETLYAQITPATADNKKIKWSSLDKKIVSVNEAGVVTALKSGKAKIKAESVDNPEAYDVCEVTVVQPATGISLNMQKCTLTSIGESVELEATVTPEDASNKNVKWKSSDESVCIVANGTVVAVGSGVCVIIATSEDGGHMATCTVTVSIYDNVKGVNGSKAVTIKSISDAAGRRINTLQRGVNILRMSDGTTKKVVVRSATK